MTIDEAIEFEKYLSKQPEICNEDFMKCEEHGQIAEWLEELKELRKIKEDYSKGMQTSYATFMYNKAIDDFEEKLLENAPKNYAGTLELGGMSCYLSANKVKQIAEKLKGGAVNE